jgi:hypothetical protein
MGRSNSHDSFKGNDPIRPTALLIGLVWLRVKTLLLFFCLLGSSSAVAARSPSLPFFPTVSSYPFPPFVFHRSQVPLIYVDVSFCPSILQML